MTGVQRTPRKRFETGSFSPEGPDGGELPLEPLPPEREPGSLRPQENAAIALIPVGTVDERMLHAMVSSLGAAFGRSVTIVKALPLPKYAFNPSRAQYHSGAILRRVEEVRTGEWDSAVGITEVDLFLPDVPFIFGEADRSTRAAIISLNRLRPENGLHDGKLDTLGKRLLSEVVHQVGLIRGLAHCPNNRCVMFLSATIHDTDKRGVQFCANCRKRLMTEA